VLRLNGVRHAELGYELCDVFFDGRTKAGPAIYYLPVKPSENTDKLLQEVQEVR
jgi:hypothetical protein